jgi:hypothetical protein
MTVIIVIFYRFIGNFSPILFGEKTVYVGHASRVDCFLTSSGINNNMEIVNLLYDQYYNGSSKVPTSE